MAELLVRAKGHWKDSWGSNDIDNLSPKELDKYNRRTQQGDVIVVKPDGWVWGKEECLPNFVVIKIPEITLEEAEKYLERDEEKYKKYRLDINIDDMKLNNNSYKEIRKKDIDEKLKLKKDM